MRDNGPMPETQTLTLTDFLLARIAEDEADARAAEWREGYGEWEYAIVHQAGQIQTVRTEGTGPQYREHVSITHDSEGLSDSVTASAAPHIARHDPARVLAECEAKRRIVELRYSWNLQAERNPDPPFGPILEAQVITADSVLRTLASIYADHPDYRAEWAL